MQRPWISDDDELRSPSRSLPTGSIWEIVKSSAHHKIQTEAIRVISEHTTPCGKVETGAVIAYYHHRYGHHWHCIAGSHKTAWRIWFDEPSMLWAESPNQRLALFRRKPVSSLIPHPTPQMITFFQASCAKAQKKWTKKPQSTQRPLLVRDELIKKFVLFLLFRLQHPRRMAFRFGGWWHVVVGRVEEFTISSVNDSRPVEMSTVCDTFQFIAWLG